jgi:hypothetical protein
LAVVAALAIAGALTGCMRYEDAYEEAVYDREPVYCYRSLADVDCYRQPYPRDARRLTNYYGPSPRRLAEPAPAPTIRLDPPPRPVVRPPELDPPPDRA